MPATRPERYAKAVASGADAICIDLEDAVAPKDKDNARVLSFPFFAEPRTGLEQRVLRINGLDTAYGLKDILYLIEADIAPDVVCIPKVTSPVEISLFNALVKDKHPNLAICALIETAEGLRNAVTIAQMPNVTYIGFGSADYSAEIGSTMGWDALIWARGQITHAAGLGGIDAMDGAWLALDDLDGLARETKRIADLGFTSRVALHPKQVPVINKIFSPDAKEIEGAQKIITAHEANKGGVLTVGGRMVDAAVVRRAMKTIKLAKLRQNK